jgi:two-component sensor histidine kinase/ligand-binding sensor domain-containing protein
MSTAFHTFIADPNRLLSIRNIHISYILATLLGALMVPNLLAQTVQFNSISLREGLSQASVTCIMQDREGYIWVGTKDGLSRYDGYSFATIRNSAGDSTSISSNSITALHQDADGFIWVGTGFGLNRLDPVTFQAKSYYHWFEDEAALSNNKVTAIEEDHMGRLWVGTENGLNLLQDKSGRFRRFNIEADDTLSLSGNKVNVLFVDLENNLWVGTGSGLSKFKPETETFKRYRQDFEDDNSLSDNDVLSITQGGADVLWIGTRNGLNKLNTSLGIFSRYYKDTPKPGLLTSNIITALLTDYRGDLWVGTPSGLNKFYDTVMESTLYRSDGKERNPLPSDFVRTLMSDRSGMIWIGTQSAGIATLNLDAPQFSSVSFPGSKGFQPEQNQIYSFVEADSSTVYVGTGSGLALFNPVDATSSFLTQTEKGEIANISTAIRSMVIDQRGRLWMGTGGQGLIAYDRLTKQTTSFKVNPDDPTSISSNIINIIIEGPNGDLWIGTSGGGLCRLPFGETQFETFRFDGSVPNSLKDNNVFSLIFDTEDLLWIGTGNAGLYSFDISKKEFKEYRAGDINRGELGSNTINDLYIDRRGHLWIGTAGGGLSLHKPGDSRFITFTQEDGLASDVILGIAGDGPGNLWLSTNGGVSAFNFITQTFRNYNEQDVLGKNTFLPGSHYRDAAGRIYFGGSNGFDYFFAEGLKENDFVPPIKITGIQLLEENVGSKQLDLALQVSDTLNLSHDHSGFSIEFAALNYKQPEKNQYAYRLVGLFGKWRYTGNRRFATFTNLSPGVYTFEVIGSNNDGLWNDVPATVTIVVKPAFWQTLWFRVAVVLLSILALYAFYRNRIHKERERRKELEEAVIQRTKEIARERDTNAVLIREVHHRVKNNLQIIMSLLNLQSNFITDSKLTSVFDEIQNRIRSMSLIHQKMYQSKDLATVNIEEYITDLASSLFNTYRLQQKVKLDVQVEVNRFKSDTLTPLGLIINEVISNALKYAFDSDNEGTIFVRLTRLNTQFFRLVIGDDGVGMAQGLDSESNTESFGTELISALTEQLNGSITRLKEKPGTVYQIDFQDVEE